MEKFKRALGMTDENGKVFDMEEIRRQVMSSLGVSAPSLETAPVPEPPFASFGDCYEACLALPAPGDPAFDALPEEARTLAVTAVLAGEAEEEAGVRAYIENGDAAYLDRTAEALRALGLNEQAEAFAACLAGQPLPDADWTLLRAAVLRCANGHPEVFCPEA